MKKITASLLGASIACLATVGVGLSPLTNEASAFPIPAIGGAIAGEVLAMKGGQPVANAPVRLTQNGNLVAVEVTGADGGFNFGNTSPGAYVVTSGGASRNVNISGHAVFVTLRAR